MTRRTFVRSIAAASLPALSTLTFAQRRRERGRELFLGEAHVDGGADHDNIVVRERGTFRALQIRVDRGAVEFDRVLVHFGDGRSMPVELRMRIRSGGESRLIDLPGDRRIVDRVEFWYRRGRWGSDRPRVTLYGIR